MKLIPLIFLLTCLISSPFTQAKRKTVGQTRRTQMTAFVQLSQALKLSQLGKYTQSTRRLFLLMKNPTLKKKQNQIRYTLASDLYNMGLYQAAIAQFQIIVQINDKKYVGKSLQKIALAAAHLKDDRLLDHAINHGSLKYISKAQKHILHYHLGEFWMRRKQFRRAITYFARVQNSSPYFYKSLYQIGLAHAELNYTKKAAIIFSSLESRRTNITDNLRSAALMGKARVYYQAKQWKKAVYYYLQVPKDSPFWYDTLLERSWALLRGGRLRAALSNFQTLHSVYYEHYYQPESLLLRSIIYLYICKYYEMEKVLDLFNKIYQPVYKNVVSMIKKPYAKKSYYQSLLLSLDNNIRAEGVQYPLPVARRILREGDFSVLHHYIGRLKEERNLIYSLPYLWRRSKVGRYSAVLVKRKLNSVQRRAGERALAHLKKIHNELKDFFNQAQYIRYEMLRSKRGFLKKKIARKNVQQASVEVFARSFYIQNGYEYWPFKGEYWLDELGNYHYVGTNSCNN